MNNTVKHIPVLLNEVLEALAPQAGKTYVDATFGNGGYSEALLKTADCRLIAVDRDPNVRPRNSKAFTAVVLTFVPAVSATLND